MPTRVDDGPPPSTYAAQIVENLEGAKARSSLGGNRPQLKDLFKKVLDLDEIGAIDDETFERNLEINHKLIWTIVKGCLLLHGSANPFEHQSNLAEQAKDGLAVIEVTIRRTPAVLFLSVSDEASYARNEGALYQWLVPCLLTLLHLDRGRSVYEATRKVLQTMLLAQSQSAKIRSAKHLILNYIRGCTDDILAYLMQLRSLPPSARSFKLPAIPSVDTGNGISGRLPFHTNSRVEADNATQAISICTSSLSLLAEYWSSGLQSHSTSDLRWVAEDLTMIPSILTALVDCEAGNADELLAFYLGSVDEVLGILEAMTQDATQISMLFRVACQITREILQRISIQNSQRPQIALQMALSMILYRLCSMSLEHPSAWKFYKQFLEAILHSTMLNEKLLNSYHRDLQLSIRLTQKIMSGSIEHFSGEIFDNCSQDLVQKFQEVLVTYGVQETDVSELPPAKRRRQHIIRNDRRTQDNFRNRYLSAVNHSSSEEIDLPQIISDTLAELPESLQCSLINELGREACRLAGSLVYGVCAFCDKIEPTKDASIDSTESGTLGEILVCVIRISQEQKIPKPRVHAMMALRRFLAHCRTMQYLDLKISALAAWPVQSLKSSIRTLRIAAVSAILHLVSNNIPKAVLRSNRRHVLDVLRSLSDKDLTLQEISIIAHGQIASVMQSEEELNLCLLRLIEYLGHGNPFVANLAYEELQKLCSHSTNLAMRLFEPYWRTLAITIVKDLQSRPQICQSVCDLLGISVLEFLRLTQFHTIPYLIVQKQQEIIHRIAEANGRDADLLVICSNSEQLAVILAHILIQPSQDPEALISSLLSQISTGFIGVDPQELLRSDPTRIAFELLQIASAPNPEDKGRARNGLGVLAERTHRKASKKHTALDIFFEENSLGIMQFLSAIVSQIRGSHSISDRRRCVGAIEEMALIAGHHLLHALPQITSCLRSAIEDPDLCNEAFGTWLTLMNSIDNEDEVANLIDPTFAIVAQYWNSFSTEVQQAAHDMITALIKSRAEWMRENVLSIPSLKGIPLLAKIESDLHSIKHNSDMRYRLQAFAERCRSDNLTVVTQALTELPAYLLDKQSAIDTSFASEHLDPAIGILVKALLNICVKQADVKIDIANEAARCIGLIGCLDPTKIDLPQEEKEIFLLSDFHDADETLEFVIFFLEQVLVKTFLAETDTRIQGLLAYAIQELLKTCGFEAKNTINKNLQPDQFYQRWRVMDDTVQDVLRPFITSRYVLEPLTNTAECAYPIFAIGMNHSTWLRQIVFDLLGKGVGQNATVIFSICRRIVRRQNIAIPTFLFPFVVLHIVLQGTKEQVRHLSEEFLKILSLPLPTDQMASESLVLCSEDIFRTLDYMSRWIQERKRMKFTGSRTSAAAAEAAQVQNAAILRQADDFLSMIPAEIISNRAVQCKSFSRALLHWEAFIREKQEEEDEMSRYDMDAMYAKLQSIYNSIDEPDGIEGISSRIVHTTFQQQMLEHRKAGRWSALQSWCELELNKHPTNETTQLEFLRSLKESGQHDTLINEFASFKLADTGLLPLTELVAESAWTTERWDILQASLAKLPPDFEPEFDTGVAKILLLLREDNKDQSKLLLDKLRANTVRQLSTTNIKSLQSCHDIVFKLHVLSGMEEMAGLAKDDGSELSTGLLIASPQRLDSLGAFPSEQQKLLSTQRALLGVVKSDTNEAKLSQSWLMTAKLARKSGFTHQAFKAIFKARELNDQAYGLEDARLLWREGHHIKAIQNLKAAIEAASFGFPGVKEVKEARVNKSIPSKFPRNLVAAKAHLFLAKWIDHAGQSQSEAIIEQYRIAVDLDNRSEKGHYHLGRHYNKLLESERAKPPLKQAESFITGEMAKLVIENFLRAVGMGAKYIHETVPRLLTLWLDLGIDVKKKVDPRYSENVEFQRHIESQRQKIFKLVATQMKKYVDRLPTFVFYTALTQVLARICHPNESIQSSLVDIVAKVVVTHAPQAMWSLLALIKSKKQEGRQQRGKECWTKVQDNAKKMNNDSQRVDIANLMRQGQRLSEQLLLLCNKDLGKRHGIISLANDLSFSHSKSSHCGLAVPIEAMLTATLPSPGEATRTHKAFAKDVITIDTFLDEVLVLNSLIKPKKVKIRGSDGKVYGILCKPKDDLRKDQRLLEFNSMITKLLRRDPQSSKRRLYVKTYAVTPLNEECGLIQWVDNCRPLRDILLDSYKLRNVTPDYGVIREILDSITANKDEAGRFEKEVLSRFPSVFREWFTEMFPEPDAWFDARLRYTRSCAVMSMVGHVLGLGDRHGENILFQGENGGTLHVDFNCLFDKGLTFEKPERVPFRLTHNMVDAFGVYGYEGPFRKSCELTLGILRQHENALMTILETFVHDPTTDFIGKKRKANPIVPDTPEGVLEAIRTKVRGLIPGESVPLSVEGHVQLLIQEATDSHNLAAMYIGWCAFL